MSKKTELLLSAIGALVAVLALLGCPSNNAPGSSPQEPAANVSVQTAAPAAGTKSEPVKPEPVKPVCASCHEPQYKFWAYGGHSTVDCVDCHGEQDGHTTEKIDPRPRMKKLERELCLECHDLAKSGGGGGEKITTDQLVVKHLDFLDSKHVIKLDRKKIKGRCLHCHDPHMGR